MRFLDILGPNNQAYLIHSEVRSHATCIVGLYERVYVGRFECAFRQFSLHDIPERAEDYQIASLHAPFRRWIRFDPRCSSILSHTCSKGTCPLVPPLQHVGED